MVLQRRCRVEVEGTVQGVGFRPFVHRLARHYILKGWVQNRGPVVWLEVQGQESDVAAFLRDLHQEAPIAAQIEAVRTIEVPLDEDNDEGFRVLPSENGAGRGFVPVDLALCAACRRELFAIGDRRFSYSLISCSQCGPRYTIIETMPYDRQHTTMSVFALCAHCSTEYDNPQDRRYHAEPIACPECGPRLELYVLDGVIETQTPVSEAVRLLNLGQIVAIKGIGGFHLACDAANDAAVADLRWHKGREAKPFALMTCDAEAARRICVVSDGAEHLLHSQEAPIVLLPRREDPELYVVEGVAPGQGRLGLMLPSNPLAALLLAHENCPPVLVMTSANLSGQPLLYREEHLPELKQLAAATLTHRRPIRRSLDDSLVAMFRGQSYPLRRARGYVPRPVSVAFLPEHLPTVMALGGEQKNTFCLNRGRDFFLGPHIGDLQSYETWLHYEASLESFAELLDLKSEFLSHDRHPNYRTTHYAEAMSLPHEAVFHHQAHIASLLAEQNIADRVIGFSWDGTGYGEDGTIWGGEVFVGNWQSLRHSGQLLPFVLPGGEQAVREPWRVALALLETLGEATNAAVYLPAVSEAELRGVDTLMRAGINCPVCSSVGRLFDAVAALLGLGLRNRFEGEAAMLLESAALAHGSSQNALSLAEVYRFSLREQDGLVIADWRPLLADILEALRRRVSVDRIAATFHTTLAHIVLAQAESLRRVTGVKRVALSGGVYQNLLLLEQTVALLEAHGFNVHWHQQVPCNDGGLALGQAILALGQALS